MIYTEVEFTNLETNREMTITISTGNRVADVLARRPKKGKYVVTRVACYNDEDFATIEEVAL